MRIASTLLLLCVLMFCHMTFADTTQQLNQAFSEDTNKGESTLWFKKKFNHVKRNFRAHHKKKKLVKKVKKVLKNVFKKFRKAHKGKRAFTKAIAKLNKKAKALKMKTKKMIKIIKPKRKFFKRTFKKIRKIRKGRKSSRRSRFQISTGNPYDIMNVPASMRPNAQDKKNVITHPQMPRKL
eukprot:gene3654-6470_t